MTTPKMKVPNLVIWPDPILKSVTKPISVFDPELPEGKYTQAVAGWLRLRKGQCQAVGAAANQFGFDVRIFVANVGTDEKIFINPEITGVEGEVHSDEACLSFPGSHGVVKRHAKIHIKYQDLKGEVHEEDHEGFDAVVLQHETDHLNGLCYVDHLDSTLKQRINKKKALKTKKLAERMIRARNAIGR